MRCPYCYKPMAKYAEDTFYNYFRCKNAYCPKPKEYMQPKDDPDFEQKQVKEE
jgi:hypothetical protein